MAAVRKKSLEAGKRHLKEKIVQMYESFLQGTDLSKENPNVWEEFFLLKPNVHYLENEIMKLSPGQLRDLKPNVNILFVECVRTLSHKHHIRILYSLQTLCTLVSTVFKKLKSDEGADIVDFFIGVENAAKCSKQLVRKCNEFLLGDWPRSLKTICLKLLLVVATGTDDINENAFLQYFTCDSILFETLVELLRHDRVEYGQDVVLLLTLLLNYRKYEIVNPYVVKLSILDNKLILNSYAFVITRSLRDFCEEYISHQNEPHSIKWLSSITNMVGNIFINDDASTKMQQIRTHCGLLLALYEVIHLNRNFVTTLAYLHEQPSGKDYPPLESSNLLVIFFKYCSIIMQDTKSEEGRDTVKLCFLILTSVAEDQYANSIMHDDHLLFRVELQKPPLRHQRQGAAAAAKTAEPLANILMDLLVEFVTSHMMKRLQTELYALCVGIIHRLVCFRKKCGVRTPYNWKQLWEALITLLKFVQSNEGHLNKKIHIFNLSLQIVNIFNLFITYGDAFLPSPQSYDELYYEIIRMHRVFENLYVTASKFSTMESDFREVAQTLSNNLINIRAIINHFSPKIDRWINEQSHCTPTGDEILEILRQNYDSLTLKLLDNLDHYERCAEKPHTEFFTRMICNIMPDTRQNIHYDRNLDLQTILSEFPPSY